MNARSQTRPMRFHPYGSPRNDAASVRAHTALASRYTGWIVGGLHLLLLMGSAAAQETPPETTRAGTETSLEQQLTENGIALTESMTIRLQPPTLAESLSAAEFTQKLTELAGNQSWERFSRDSVTAPIKINLKYILDQQGTRIGHDVHAAFVAYAALDALRDEDLMRQIFGRSVEEARSKEANPDEVAKSDEEPSRDIPAEELERLGIAQPDSENERYAAVELPLLNKVFVRGTVRIEKRETPQSIQLFWSIDPRFEKSETYSNTWTKILRNEVGMPTESEPQPYAGCGGFISVTQIDSTDVSSSTTTATEGDDDMTSSARRAPLLVESRMIMMEPPEWFAGSNALRSKLPLVLQENARNFRRQLAK